MADQNPFAFRNDYADELSDPSVRNRLFGYTRAEVGGQGPEAEHAFMESVFNRAHARSKSISETLNSNYYPAITHQRAARSNADYSGVLDNVLGGSNYANYGTGNASGTVGFNGGPGTAGYGGERFGVEGPDLAWAMAHGYTGGSPMASAFAADRSGALSADQGLGAIAASLKGKTQMADQQPPSLAAQFLTGGPGALFGKPDTSEGGYNWGHALNNAAAWMQSLDTKGASLGAIKNSEDYALVPGPDGSVYKIHKPTGKVSTVAGPQGKIVDVGVDQGGNPIKGYQLGNRLFPISALTAGGAAGGSGSPLGQDQWLAKGVSEVDPNKQGEEYLAQYSPDVQAYVRALQEGRLPISSNARKGLAMVGNKAAAKYGEDIGVPMDATSLAERRKFATELGATANPALFGGQRTATQTAIAHLKETLDAVDALGNSNGLGSEYLAGAVNRPMDSKFTSTDRAAKLTALLDRATAYAGERSKLLSGRAGGQEERQQIANEIFGGQKSDEALRAAVRSELQVMMGRAHPLDQKLESSNLLPPTKEKNRVIGPEQQQIIDDIIRRTSKDYAPVKGSAASPSSWEAAQKAGWK